jgi:large subunit ribosomal protein L54
MASQISTLVFAGRCQAVRPLTFLSSLFHTSRSLGHYYGYIDLRIITNSSIAGIVSSCDATVATGVNILKKGSDPPLKPDSEYPEWLWDLAKPPKTLSELRRGNETELPMREQKRLLKLANRDGIRTRNENKSK